KNNEHIGYPLSQTLFRTADVRRLSDFFRWISLAPSEEMTGDELLAYFRAWAPEKNLSVGARRMLETSEYNATLAAILQAYAAHWDGTRAGRSGARSAPLRVVVDPFPRLNIALVALQPEGFP